MNYYEVEIYDSVLREYLTLYVYAIDDFQAEKSVLNQLEEMQGITNVKLIEEEL